MSDPQPMIPDEEPAAIPLGDQVEAAPRTEPMWATPMTDAAPRAPEASAPPTPDAPATDKRTDLYPYFWDTPRPGRDPAEKRHATRAALAWFIAAMLGAGVGGGAVWLRLAPQRAGEVRVVRPPVTNVSAGASNAPALVAQAVLPSIVQLEVNGIEGEGLGSGVVYSSDGYIITNNHVIEGADQITVNLPNGTKLAGSVIGTAANIGVDIAVVKVAPNEPLTPATFGSESALHVGDLAVAIGSPFGLSATVTAGIISALHRNTPFGGADAIQTDAPINPGNSGGALANAEGVVVGINTAIVGSSAGNVGVGFAIPADIARKVTEQIIKTGRAELAFLGISGDSLPNGKGARVSEVNAGSAAGGAGIKVDDIIVSLDGQTVASMDQLISLLIQHNVGDQVRIGLVRDGKKLTVTATLRARPESE